MTKPYDEKLKPQYRKFLININFKNEVLSFFPVV